MKRFALHPVPVVAAVCRVFLAALLCVAALCGSMAARASAGDADVTAPAGSPVLKVGFYQLDGFFEYDGDGNPVGYGVDYLSEITRRTGIGFEYVPVDDWSEATTLLDAGLIDIKMPVESSTGAPMGDNHVFTTEDILYTYHVILTGEDRTDLNYEDYDAIATMRLAAEGSFVEHTGVMDYLTSIGVADNITLYDSFTDCRAAFDAGEVDGIVTNVMDMTPGTKVLLRFDVVKNYIMMSEGNPYYAQINQAASEIKLDDPTFETSLYQTWFPYRNQVPLTKEELAYAQLHPVIRVGVYDDRRPASYIDPDTGEFTGVCIDLATKLAQSVGVTFEFVPITTATATSMLDTGEIDVVMPVPNANFFESPTPLMTTSSLINMTVSVALQEGRAFDGDAPMTVAVVSTNQGIKQMLQSEYLSLDIVKCADNAEGLAWVQQGKVDAFAQTTLVLDYIMQSPRYEGLLTVTSSQLLLSYCLAVPADADPTLLTLLNKGISRVSRTDREDVVAYYTTYRRYEYTLADSLYEMRVPLAFGGGVAVVVVLAVAFYQTQQRRYIRRIEGERARAEAANRAKSDFLSRMSHDIRTPMNGIMGMTRMAYEHAADDEMRHYLDNIAQSSKFLLGLVNDILDLAKVESGSIELHPEPYRGEDFVSTVQTIIAPMACERDVKLELHVDPDVPAIVVDPLRFNQIFLNLLSNAVKFTPAQGTVRLSIEFGPAGGRTRTLRGVVCDTGCGMSKEFLLHAFEPFEQENADAERKGTGLGLPIVHNLTKAMGGTVDLLSTPGEGTVATVVMEVPVLEASELKEVATVSGRGAPDETKRLAGARVLVAEDNRINREIVSALLQKWNIEPVLRENGLTAVEAFSASEPFYYDAVLMDVSMPVMGGLDAARAIRALDRDDARAVPIIATTANAFDRDVSDARQAGMDAHLAKPLDPDALSRTLAGLIARFHDARG